MDKRMSLQKAVDMGEYLPEYLSTFPDWSTLSRHVQFQYIRTAIENRRKHLLSQWAETNNMLDFSLKPDLSNALKNIEDQIYELEENREKIFIEYSK